jgi:transcriptional regulator with XRE-family HTH domain
VGRVLRALRQRRGLRQLDVATAAGVSQTLVSLIERGHLSTISLRTLRGVLAALDARTEVQVTWRGGALDRLLDERHSSLVATRSQALGTLGWVVMLETTYSVYGERGAIDVFAGKAAARAALVEEVKSDLTSLEELGRKTDAKVRLARTRLCRERFGFDPSAVGRLLILPETDSARRKVARLGSVLDVWFPARRREIRAWLQNPIGDIGGILFVKEARARSRSAGRRGRERIRTRPS